MADTNIALDTSARRAKEPIQLGQQCAALASKIREVFGKMATYKDGSDYSGLSGPYGVATGEAETLYSETNALNAILATLDAYPARIG